MLEWIAVAEEDKKHVVDLQAAMDKAGFFAPFINYHVEKVKAESEKKEVADILVANRELGDKLQVRGTPLLVIGDEIIPHAVGLEELESRLNALKAEAAKAE
jgi:protein-disulfide isomerase